MAILFKYALLIAMGVGYWAALTVVSTSKPKAILFDTYHIAGLVAWVLAIGAGMLIERGKS